MPSSWHDVMGRKRVTETGYISGPWAVQEKAIRGNSHRAETDVLTLNHGRDKGGLDMG